MIRCYRDLRSLETFEERFHYLKLFGAVGEPTFGFERWINQNFYTSKQWKDVRRHVIIRDYGCDLGIEGYEIHDRIIIHHMNPMTASSIENGDEDILDSEFLIATTHRTHNAIHYGDERQLPRRTIDRAAGDTKLW
jgi:hypothetical protein